MNVQKSTITLTCDGDDGSATASGAFPTHFKGKVLGFYIDYSATQAATTDVTITDGVFTILTVSSTATAGQYFPRCLVDLEDGTAATTVYDYFYVDGTLTVSVAEADDTETVTITAVVIED